MKAKKPKVNSVWIVECAQADLRWRTTYSVAAFNSCREAVTKRDELNSYSTSVKFVYRVTRYDSTKGK